jgi:GxxExxY protein
MVHELEPKLRCDLFIENALVVELKSVNEINQFMKLQPPLYESTNAPIGLLINFNEKIFSRRSKNNDK